jgi:hypothetical protein
MNPRDEQFLKCYEKHRYEDQQKFYEGHIEEFETARSQAIILTSILIGCAGITSVLAAADVLHLKALWVILAIIFPALGTAFAAYDRLYAFEQQAKLYKDARGALDAHRYRSLGKASLSESEFRAVVSDHVQEVEGVLRSEQGQWGQLISQIPTAEPATVSSPQKRAEG